MVINKFARGSSMYNMVIKAIRGRYQMHYVDGSKNVGGVAKCIGYKHIMCLFECNKSNNG